ncbi:MAG TPA: FtsK/SpoIIIE domain-containing protein, partial [Iamia sp.]|nr:FtsK/SpoIIIE domain-containing protein [Iamia sp.]
MAERRLSLVDASDPSVTPVDLHVQGDDDTPLAEVHAALARHAPAGAPLFVGSSLFPTDGTLGETTLTDGDRVSWGGPVQPATIERRWTRWELRVVGGPAAGQVVPLPPGQHVIGRSGSLLAVADDALMSRTHLRLSVEGDTLTVEDAGSANGTQVEGEPLTGAVPLVPGAVVQAGASLLTVVPAATPELRLVHQPDGRRGLNRRFRVGADELPPEVPFPTKPEPGDRPGMNVLLLVAPAVLIGVMVLVLNAPPTMLMFMVMSPILGIGGAVGRRRQHDKKVARDFERYRTEALAARERLLELRRQETEALRHRHPDPADTVQCARAAGRLLWARRGSDGDLLELRVGSGLGRSTIRAQNAETDDPTLWMAPITVRLTDVGGVGIVGDLDRARGLARSLVLQAATFHSPAELRIVTLAEGDEGDRTWGWVRWLPHARWAADEDFVLTGSDVVSTRQRLAELKDLIARRKEVRAASRDATVLPLVLVVHDGAARLLALGFAEVLRDGPAVGVHSITLDEMQVPEGCDASVTFGPDGDDARLEQAGRPSIERIVADAVDVASCGTAGRCLAPLKVIGEEGAVELPPQLRLLDVLQMPVPSAEAVGRLWATTTRDPGAPVGLTTGGPLVVDLTRDGPHGIIAGASRSGKSEFLKTFIASLAARNHPDDLSFLFIDFKGGNDYQVAATLPHTVDLATQTDQAGFERSLQLLDAEILRRQQIAKELQTSTLEGYWAAQAAQPPGTTPVMGRLVVIVDEFAELAQKNPLQLERLVSVARVGAAYGVHLILATQRPAGVVSGQIDANAPLRVCFRTTAKEHSSDVLGSTVAADIAERHRGRGYKRAHQESPGEFQCARVGNARPGSDSAQQPLRVVVEPWATAGHVPPAEQGVGEV